MRFWILLVAILCCGCGGYFQGIGHDMAVGAVNQITTDDSKKALAGIATEATKAARDEALGPTTDADIQKLIKDTGATTRSELEMIIVDVLKARLKEALRAAIDEALGKKTLSEADTLREELVGKPAQDDVNALIDAASPHLAAAAQQAVQAALQPIKSESDNLKIQADAEAAKWKPIAIGFGVGGACLLICLVVLVLALRSHRQVIEGHQRVIASLIKQRDGDETED